MNTKGPYRVYAGETPEHCRESGIFVGEYDTVAEAKKRAKFALTDDYRRLIECSYMQCYSRVENKEGECLHDYFCKGYYQIEQRRALKRLIAAARKAQSMFSAFAEGDPGACMTAGSEEAQACDMAEELEIASGEVEKMYDC